MVKLGTVEGHFRDVGLSLSDMRKDVKFTDLQFVCFSTEEGKNGKTSTKRIRCHQALFASRSNLLFELFNVAQAKDPGGQVAISIDNVDGEAVEHIVEYLYHGECTVSRAKHSALVGACQTLGLNLDIQLDKNNKVRDSTSDDSETAPSKVMRLNPAAGGEKKFVKNIAHKIKLGKGGRKSVDEERKAKKRRLTGEEEGGGENKKPAPKKYRDDAGDSSKANNGLDKKSRIGPASKVNRSSRCSPESNADSLSNSFLTQVIQTCQLCNAFFVSKAAFDSHMEAEHGSEKEPERKPRPGPKSKKNAATIKLERKKREEKLSSSSSEGHKSDADSKQHKEPERRKPGPKSRSKPGPASKKQPAAATAASCKKSFGSNLGCADFLVSSSDSEDGAKLAAKKDKKTTTPTKSKIRIALGSAKTPTSEGKVTKHRPICLQNSFDSPSSVPRKCKFCDEMFDKVQLVKNHTLNHFKHQLYTYLPSSTPFRCPECGALSRDKVTLLRHWCFTHKKILDFCAEEDLKGLPISLTEFVGTPKATKKSTIPASPKAKDLPKAPKSKALVSSDSSDDDGAAPPVVKQEPLDDAKSVDEKDEEKSQYGKDEVKSESRDGKGEGRVETEKQKTEKEQDEDVAAASTNRLFSSDSEEEAKSNAVPKTDADFDALFSLSETGMGADGEATPPVTEAAGDTIQ